MNKQLYRNNDAPPLAARRFSVSQDGLEHISENSLFLPRRQNSSQERHYQETREATGEAGSWQSHGLSPLYLCWRRALDLTFGLCGLLLMCLLLPVLAPLLYLDSPGSVFYSQERVGYGGRTFRLLKFRSMSTSAGRAARAAWVVPGDSRVTRVGRLLRATHLDELPQALNILRGEMSLIGPRPERPAYVADFERQHPLYHHRSSVRPGLTGWAQVKYGYGDGEQDELVKLQYDLFYIEHRSLLFDMQILLKTIREVVLCHGL